MVQEAATVDRKDVVSTPPAGGLRRPSPASAVDGPPVSGPSESGDLVSPQF